jgi:UDP-glucose 4-epimerase
MRILVTGSSGLVGRYVADELARDHEVHLLDVQHPHRDDLVFHQIDLLDSKASRRTIKGYDVVVHLAGIPHPLNNPPEQVFRTNTVGTFNVLEACAQNEIRRCIFLSSESTLGFAFSSSRMVPEYVPIDESHPLRPQDPYGLSKLACELLCQGYTRKTGMQTLCLRPPWIWVPEPKEVELYRQLIRDYVSWSKNLWACIHVKDVAQAVRLCIESSSLPPQDVFFICADENWTGIESRTLVKQFYPETNLPTIGFKGMASLISNEKARKGFGFQPQFSPKDILGAIEA